MIGQYFIKLIYIFIMFIIRKFVIISIYIMINSYIFIHFNKKYFKLLKKYLKLNLCILDELKPTNKILKINKKY